MGDQSTNESIGKRVARLRKLRHLTQAQLADQIGSTAKHVSEIERGVTGISIDIQIQLSEKLHCSLDYLIKGEDYKSVDSFLPSRITEILHSQDVQEMNVLMDYLNLYEKSRQK